MSATALDSDFYYDVREWIYKTRIIQIPDPEFAAEDNKTKFGLLLFVQRRAVGGVPIPY